MKETATTYIMPAESGAETARLVELDALTTRAMGGALPEELDLSQVGHILDLACGPGGWVLETAYRYPGVHVVGVDRSQAFIEYARASAGVQKLSNASFQVMNVLEELAFPDATFDFLNMRYLAGFMPRDAWEGFLAQCWRMLRPGGTLRWSEGEMSLTTSPALNAYNALISRGLYQAGQSFSCDGTAIGITVVMRRLLTEAGFRCLPARASVIEASVGTDAYEPTRQILLMASLLVQPFLLRMHLASKEELEQLFSQAMVEMEDPHFCSVGVLFSYLAMKPGA